jgi:hypothetical protein
MVPLATAAGMVAAVLVRPWLWWTALRQLGRLAPPRWWRRAPFLPLPTPAYLRFRMETQYGASGAAGADGPAGARDLITYLEWCREPAR